MYEDEKITLLETLGIDYMFSLDFDDAMMKISPENFAKNILSERF